MTFDLASILQSKEALRRKLKDLPIVEKLEMLEVLRDRALSLRCARSQNARLARLNKKQEFGVAAIRRIVTESDAL